MMSISCMQTEIDRLFAELEKRAASSVCLTADRAKAGTSSISMALYERYLLAGYATLYVDLNIANPSFIASELLVDLVEHKTEQKIYSGIVAPVCQSTHLNYRNPTSLKKQLTKWHNKYQRVIFDTMPLQNSGKNIISALLVAEACDASILVVKGGKTTSEELQKNLCQLQFTNCPFIGIALNQYKLKPFSEAILSSSLFSLWLPEKLKTKLQQRMEKLALFKNVI